MAKAPKRPGNGTNYIDTVKAMTASNGGGTLSDDQISMVMNRRNAAQADALLWKGLLDQAHRWATPNMNSWRDAQLPLVAPAANLGAPVADLTLIIAHRRLLSKLLVGMIPKGQQWFKFMPGDKYESGTELYDRVQKMADLFTDKFFKLLDRSRFYLCASEALSDCLISTGFMTLNEGTKDNPFLFSSISDAYVLVEGDAMGGICGLYRDWVNVTVGQIPHIWPNAKKPSDAQSTDTVTIYECSYVDWDADESKRYVYALLTTNREVLYVAREASWPWIYFRMSVLPGETRGRGPSLEAAPTAATINVAIQNEMTAAAFMANPMYMASSDSAINTETFVAYPGIIVPVQMTMGEWPITNFPQSGNPSFTTMVANELRGQINELLFTEPLGPINGPRQTATESTIRYRENLETFSAMIPRIQAEFFETVIRRGVYIMRRLEPEFFEGEHMDQELINQIVSLDGKIVGLRFETPLMTARGEIKRDKILAYMESAAMLLGPEAAMASLVAQEIPEYLRESLGLEAKVIKSPDELRTLLNGAAEELVAGEEAANANAMEAEQAQATAQTANDFIQV